MTSPMLNVGIVGAGLSGMISALVLQREGYRPVIFERRAQVGGLCGTFTMDDHEFVIACNDFGTGFAEILRDLEVPIAFESKTTQVFYDGMRVILPPGMHTLPAVAKDPGDWLRLALGLLRHKGASRDLETAIQSVVSPSRVADLAKLPAYLMGVTPSDLGTDYFRFEKEFGYQYSKPACPIGGPGVLSDTLAQEIRSRGGRIYCDCSVKGIQKQNGIFAVDTNLGVFECQALIDTREAAPEVSGQAKRGLPLSMLCVVLDRAFPFPKGVHTVVYYPPGVSEWFGALDRGLPADEFGFHLFCSDLPRRGNEYTVNVYFYLPRGIETLDADASARIEGYLLRHIEEMLPGFAAAVRYTRFVTPEDFQKRHGLSSRVMPFVHPPGAARPPATTAVPGQFRAGHTVHPPGEHAGAAVLSGKLTALEVSRYLWEKFDGPAGEKDHKVKSMRTGKQRSAIHG